MENHRIAMESIMQVKLPMESSNVPLWQRKAMIAQTPVKPKQRTRRHPPPITKERKAAASAAAASRSDRFIPNRASMNLDLCRHKILIQSSSTQSNTAAVKETGKFGTVCNRGLQVAKYRETLAANLLDSTSHPRRVLDFSDAAIESAFPKSSSSAVRTIYRYEKKDYGAGSAKPCRHISASPSRILDAPELRDDYYLNLLSWSSDKILAVALNQTVYLWNADSGNIEEIQACTGNDYVTSVSWIGQGGGSSIAIGTDNADVQLWDASTSKLMRTMRGHTGRVGSLAWNGHILSSGSRDSTIFHHDVRSQRHQVATLRGHQQEVCGLTWSPDGSTLASGGNDNLLCLWDSAGRQSSSSMSTSGNSHRPRSVLTGHVAAVKALAWCPWERHVLASGGGTADRTIKFWNSSNASLLHSVDTNSQVCGLLWSKTEKELLSSHGFSHYQLCLWNYPTMTKVKELKGHTARVLHMAMSPDGSAVVSAAADETLRFWDIFPAMNPVQKSVHPTLSKYSSLAGIR